MKKIILVLFMLFMVSPAFADTIMVESNVTMTNFWEKNGKEAEKVLEVGRQIIHANKLKRAPIILDRKRIVNADTNTYTKIITVYIGILPYINNDDELAYVLSHELSHAQEMYGGGVKLVSMYFNSKKYESKADLEAIDYMVKAGYNPIAAITEANKILDEPLWDWGFAYSHPKGSKRMIAMYEYIYKKYPQYLSSDMVKTPEFQDFVTQYNKEISAFIQSRSAKQTENSI